MAEEAGDHHHRATEEGGEERAFKAHIAPYDSLEIDISCDGRGEKQHGREREGEKPEEYIGKQ